MTENTHKIFVTTGASNHTETVRASYDLYTTDPQALERFLDVFNLNKNVWECACGLGHLSEVLRKRDYKVYSTDINNYGYKNQNRTINFLSHEVLPQANEGLLQCDILTNPPYNCFDIDTQCYTKKGWKYYHELNYEDEILSVNPETQQLEWSEIEKIIIRDKDPNEKMYHFKHSHMDIMVTENHRMFVFSKKTNKLAKRNNDLLKSERIRSTHFIPKCGYSWQGEEKQFFVLPAINGTRYAQPVFKDEIKINMDSWLKFFGLWLADGCVRHTKNTQGNYRKTVCIKQLAERKIEIENILNDLPFKYIEREDSYNRKNKTINFVINNEQLWQYLLQFGYSENKFIPEELKDLSSRQLKILLDSYFFGDGSYYMEKGRIFRTISKQLAQDIWEILLKLGYLSHITNSSEYTNGKGEVKRLYQIIYNPSPMYNRLTFPSNKNAACLTEYSNKVWCVNLKKNGVFLLRRNGFEFVCGNCALEFVKQALNIIEDGYNVVMFLRLQFLEGKTRKAFFENNPPKYVYIFSDRIKCTNQNAPHSIGSSAICYAWFVWQKGFTGDPIIKWL